MAELLRSRDRLLLDHALCLHSITVITYMTPQKRKLLYMLTAMSAAAAYTRRTRQATEPLDTFVGDMLGFFFDGRPEAELSYAPELEQQVKKNLRRKPGSCFCILGG